MSTTTAPRAAPAVKAWPYRADLPQRYSINYERYMSLGGPVRLEEFVKGYVAGGMNQSDMARFYFFCLVFDQIMKEGLEGDLLELGTYKGHTATLLAGMARKLDRTAYVLDTFEGFNAADLKGIDSAAKAGVFGDTSLAAVRTLVGDDHVRFVQGYFPDTASQLPPDGRYCLVHIDCDLYSPIKSALEYFYPRVVPGGFLIVHDYSSLYWNGAEKAVDEFFADKAEATLPLPDSAGSVVVRKARTPASSDNWLVRKQAALARNEWTPAGNGAIRELLGDGWSGPEDWGVWGVGGSHELRLVFRKPVPREIMLQADVHVVLAGARQTQQVDVWAAGKQLAIWEFTPQNNRGVRSVRIPGALLDNASGDAVCVAVTFRPHRLERPKDLTPESNDDRPLGLALHRVRCGYEARDRNPVP